MNTISIADTYFPTRFPLRLRYARVQMEFESGPGKMTPEEFWDFCQDNRKLRAELTKEGDVIIMPPTGFRTGIKNSDINLQLGLWAKNNRMGKVTDSNAGFVLPNGATYAPDATWTDKKRLEKFSAEELEKFLPLCPDFVIELRSRSDSLKELQEKMQDYIDNGTSLGWLIDPKNKQIFIYRPDKEMEVLRHPKTVSGEDVLVGFELDLSEIW